jgi:glycine oxidase
MTQTVVIGGGVIGLSIAYELSKRNRRVVLLERDQVGRKASWFGAGILAPANGKTAIHPVERLESLSNELHPQWADELLQSTGIDNGYAMCGGLYVARTGGEMAALQGASQHWSEWQIEFEPISVEQAKQLIPGLTIPPQAKLAFVPTEAQIRNPRHLQALLAACRQNGVEIVEGCSSLELVVQNHQTSSVHVGDHHYVAENYCIAGGPWSEQILKPFRIPLPSTPVRGQMALFKLPVQQFVPIINEGPRYLVPRSDGHVLAGSTVEEVGFNSSIEQQDIDELTKWANEFVPALNQQTFVTAWAGLRPGTYDGFPYIGSVGRSRNTFVATGHFKTGLHLSTATAVVMADLLQEKNPPIDLAPFAPARAEFHQSIETR